MNLAVQYDHPINFYSYVSYVCDEGYWFEEDREQEDYLVMCKPDGTFKYPDEWPKCVNSELKHKEKSSIIPN